jgi:hypothetical protein
VQPRDRLKLQDAIEFALKWPSLLEAQFLHDLHRAVGAEGVSGQPDLPAAAASDEPNQFVVWYNWSCGRLRHK